MAIFSREPLIERLARQGRWPLLKTGTGYFRVRVGDGADAWTIYIDGREEEPLVTFCAIYPVQFAWSSVTPDLSMGLLRRNRNVRFGRWCLHVIDGGGLTLALHYTAIRGGLCLVEFNAVCSEMVAERSAVHAELCRTLPYLGWMTRDECQASPQERVKGRAKPLAVEEGMVWLEE